MRNLSLTLLLFVSSMLFAQYSIQSTVFDSKNGLPIELGTVQLVKASDSTLVQGVQTDTRGSFILTKIRPGDYKLKITSVGYKVHRAAITVSNRNIILKNIQLPENVELLKDLEVKGTAAQLVVKGDTLEYNATAFKTEENAVVEELLKKLPGLEISSEGKITVNGEEVKKIRIDGKKFFDGDIEQATKNLPADMIDKIQVLDQKSDMALLTGFEDGDTERIINLTTKSNRRRGIFGNVGAGIGLDINDAIRYDSKISLNIMDNDSQTSINGSANNLNNSRSSRGRGSWGGGSNGGITESQNIGINNNTIVNKKIKIGGDLTTNHANNYSDTYSNRTSYLSDATYNDISNTQSGNEKYAANARLEVEWKIDSLNTIIIQPNIEYNTTDSYSKKEYSYLTEGDSTSWGNSRNNGINSSISGGLNVIYNRKFKSKIGRTFTLNLNTDFSQSDNDSYNLSNKFTDDTISIDQFTTNRSNRFNTKVKMSYVEPLWNLKNMIEIAASINSANTTSEKLQYSRDENLDYTIKDSIYSNNFENNFLRESIELNYRYTDANYKIMLGINGEPSQTRNTRSYGNGLSRDTVYGVFNFAPTARLQYNFGKKKFARFDYRGRTEQPSINQMQPVKNNSDLMSEDVGNPTLNPAFSHNLRLMYSAFDDKKFSSFNTYLSANATKDALVSNRIYDNTLKQYNQTLNSEAIPLSLMWNVMFNTPLIAKRLHFNTNTNTNYRTQYSYISRNVNLENIDISDLMKGNLSKTRSIGGSEAISLTFTHDIIEIGLRGKIGYSNSLNNLKDQEAIIWDWSGRGNILVRLPYNFTIGSDITYTDRAGYSQLDLKEIMLNASIDKTMFKNKATLSIKATDLLRQQLNIRQTVGDNYVQYNSYNTLPSYFLVSFTYKINKFNGAKNPEQNEERRFGPPSDGERHQRSGGGSDGGGRNRDEF